MKNILLFCFALIMGGIITSCSSSQEVTAQNDNGSYQHYRFRKTYYRNKIIYRDARPEKPKPLRQKEMFSASLTETSDFDPAMLKQPLYILSETPASEEKKQTTTDKEKKNVVKTFRDNSKHLYTTIKTGDFKSLKENRIDRKDGLKDTKMDSYDIFAIVGFAFGIVALFNITFVFALLGLIFSIIGLKSSMRVFAIVGLICSAIGLAIWLASLA